MTSGKKKMREKNNSVTYMKHQANTVPPKRVPSLNIDQ